MAFSSDAQRRWWFAHLAQAHVDAVRAYSFGGGWKPLNAALREGKALTAAQQEHVRLLDEAIEGTQQPLNETVYRGVNFGGAGMPNGASLAARSLAQREELISESLANYAERRFPIGSTFTLGGYQSTSRNLEPALDASLSRENPGLIFEIRARKGLPLQGLQHAHVDDEDEVLLPRTTRYRVVQVRRRDKLELLDGHMVERTVVAVQQVQ